MRQPKVSVGITVKNSAGTIFECIESIMKSSYPIYEIVVVDAFSTDGTWEILKSFGKRVRALQKKGNVAVGRNEIIKKAKGELIAFTDADCVVERFWLESLVYAFSEKGVVASGGFCGTSENSNYLQSLIGRELEDRFRHFPKYVSRFPFMNVCVSSKLAKKNLIDERLRAAEDADFFFRFSKKGKIVYAPNAKISHSHRASLADFFRQQFNYGKYAPLMYSKYKNMAGGDKISKPTMVAQPPLFLFGISAAAISYFYHQMFLPSAISFLALGAIYIYDSARLSKNLIDFFSYLGIFFLRTLAWSAGFLSGIKFFFGGKK